MTIPLGASSALPMTPPTIRQVLAGEVAWRVPLSAPEIVLPDGVRDLDFAGLSLRKACAALRAVREKKNGKDFDVNIVASTGALVRDNGIIPIEAWREDIDLFLANPAILWQHESWLGPIGHAVAVELKGKGMNGRMLQWWLFNDITEESQKAHALFALGDMRAASVGFYIRAFHRVSEEELKKLQKKFPAANEWTWIVDRAELLETSGVSVGADPGALTPLSVGASDLRNAFADLGERYAYGRAYESEAEYVRALASRCAGGEDGACAVLIDGFANDAEKREEVDRATETLIVAMEDDAALTVWLDEHRDTLERIGNGCLKVGAEFLVGEALARKHEAGQIRCANMSPNEVLTFIVSNVARVIDDQAREAHDRLKEIGR